MAMKPDDRPVHEQNGMTEDEWSALSPDAKKWRTDHPRNDRDAQRAADRPAAVATDADRDDSTNAHGAQVVLAGDARNAARGGAHGSIEANTAARDAAIAAGHVTPDTVHAAATDIAREEVFVDPEIEVRRAAEERKRDMAQGAHALATNPPVEPDGKTEDEQAKK
jgi:hypothetical protein